MLAKKKTNARIFLAVVLAAVCAFGVLPAHTQDSDQPNLQVDSVRVDGETGAAFNLNVSVRNTGTGRSTATTLRFYRSTDATITSSDTEVDTSPSANPVGALAASGTSSESTTLTARMMKPQMPCLKHSRSRLLP